MQVCSKKYPVRNTLKDHPIAGSFMPNMLQPPENPHNDKRSFFPGVRQLSWEVSRIVLTGGNNGWTVGGKVSFLLV